MNEELKKAIEASKVLSNEQKQPFLARLDSLTPERVQEVLTALKEADQKYAVLVEEGVKKEREINEKYIQDMKHLIPHVMQEIEKEERVNEETDLENVISELNNV